MQQSIIKCGKKPGLFYGIVLNTKEVLVKLLQQHKVPPKPQLSVDIKEFRKMQDIKQELDQQVQAIHYIEDSELPELHRQPEEIKGIFKTKDRKMVEKEIKDTERRLSEIKSDLTKVVTRYGYKNVQSFIRAVSYTHLDVYKRQGAEDESLLKSSDEEFRQKNLGKKS